MSDTTQTGPNLMKSYGATTALFTLIEPLEVMML